MLFCSICLYGSCSLPTVLGVDMHRPCLTFSHLLRLHLELIGAERWKKRRCTSAFTASTEITRVVARLAFERHSNVFIWNKRAVGHRVGSADRDLRERGAGNRNDISWVFIHFYGLIASLPIYMSVA